MRTRLPARPHRSAPRSIGARERIDRTAYQLFSRHGIRAVGIDAVVAHAGVAKMTLYRHYPSKDDLALAFLRRREELWTRSWLQREAKRRGRTLASSCSRSLMSSTSGSVDPISRAA